MSTPTPLSRRQFLRRNTATALGGLTLPYFVPSDVLAAPGTPGANERIGLAVIGTGRRARQMLGEIGSVCKVDCRLVAACDVWRKKAEEYVRDFDKDVLKTTGNKYAIYEDYRELLNSRDVDGVILTTTEHSRALPCIRACQAGKDVYAEKPLSLTIREGRAMVQAVRKYHRVCQVGTGSRSKARNREATEYLRNGRIGKIHTVLCQNWVSSRPLSEFNLPAEPVPEGLNWDVWCGQTEPLPFNMQIYLTYNNPGWHNLQPYSAGWLANAGSHALGLVQWGLGTDETGPVEVWAERKAPDAPLTYRYADGTLLKLVHSCSPMGIPGWKSPEKPGEEASTFGAIFLGDKGTLVEHSGRFNTKPISISKEPIRDSDFHVYHSDGHVRNWVDCMKSRKPPICDVEIGHRTCTICHLGNIARWTGRRLRWDPVKETFPGDAEANSHLERPQRKGYEIAKEV